MPRIARSLAGRVAGVLPGYSPGLAPGGDGEREVRYHKRDFWATENRKFVQPHFRMRKVAREVRRVTRDRECDLLDIGCGPAALASLMLPGVHYHGIDIAIAEPAPNLIGRVAAGQPVFPGWNASRITPHRRCSSRSVLRTWGFTG